MCELPSNFPSKLFKTSLIFINENNANAQYLQVHTSTSIYYMHRNPTQSRQSICTMMICGRETFEQNLVSKNQLEEIQ